MLSYSLIKRDLSLLMLMHLVTMGQECLDSSCIDLPILQKAYLRALLTSQKVQSGVPYCRSVVEFEASNGRNLSFF